MMVMNTLVVMLSVTIVTSSGDITIATSGDVMIVTSGDVTIVSSSGDVMVMTFSCDVAAVCSVLMLERFDRIASYTRGTRHLLRGTSDPKHIIFSEERDYCSLPYAMLLRSRRFCRCSCRCHCFRRRESGSRSVRRVQTARGLVWTRRSQT